MSSKIGAAFLIACVFAAICLFLFWKPRNTEAQSVAPAPSAPSVAAPKPAAPSFGERLASAQNIPAALAVVPRAAFVDGAEFSKGHWMLAGWASAHLEWAEVGDDANTTWAKTRKDPDAERGKTTCVSGTVRQIAVDRSDLGTFYNGTITSGSGDWWRFTAVRDTGDLVQNSAARICGIVTGVSDYANTGGGQTPSVTIVGLFDLPANRAKALRK